MWYSDVVRQSQKCMKSKLSPPLTMPLSLESKGPHHQSVQVPPSKMNESDKLTMISDGGSVMLAWAPVIGEGLRGVGNEEV